MYDKSDLDRLWVAVRVQLGLGGACSLRSDELFSGHAEIFFRIIPVGALDLSEDKSVLRVSIEGVKIQCLSSLEAGGVELGKTKIEYRATPVEVLFALGSAQEESTLTLNSIQTTSPALKEALKSREGNRFYVTVFLEMRGQDRRLSALELQLSEYLQTVHGLGKEAVLSGEGLGDKARHPKVVRAQQMLTLLAEFKAAYSDKMPTTEMRQDRFVLTRALCRLSDENLAATQLWQGNRFHSQTISTLKDLKGWVLNQEGKAETFSETLSNKILDKLGQISPLVGQQVFNPEKTALRGLVYSPSLTKLTEAEEALLQGKQEGSKQLIDQDIARIYKRAAAYLDRVHGINQVPNLECLIAAKAEGKSPDLADLREAVRAFSDRYLFLTRVKKAQNAVKIVENIAEFQQRKGETPEAAKERLFSAIERTVKQDKQIFFQGRESRFRNAFFSQSPVNVPASYLPGQGMVRKERVEDLSDLLNEAKNRAKSPELASEKPQVTDRRADSSLSSSSQGGLSSSEDSDCRGPGCNQ
eukprot:TRINITY_DN15138_c0_g1_i9.p1 TRINITY_DN15138_c0_g1~~TRINITY_DN15138_c0_g1_i9.p1  ORF type:complete len:528 (+),score=-75.71 TRINITY_DN15138_c0_g1_i9:254-1837(+)